MPITNYDKAEFQIVLYLIINFTSCFERIVVLSLRIAAAQSDKPPQRFRASENVGHVKEIHL